MKTARFSQVVQKAGKPQAHLLWTAPEVDTEFKKALKAGRIMTVHQAHGQTDYGTVGYVKGAQGQFLIFPKSLSSFEDKRVVGVKYDLLGEKKIPKNQRAKPVKPPKPTEHRPRKPSEELATHDDEEPEQDKGRRTRRSTEPNAVAPDISSPVRKEIQKAMRFLKAGKQVQAYEVLEKLMKRATE